MQLDFTFSDTIAGYAADFDPVQGRFDLVTSDGRTFRVHLTPNTYARQIFNLGEAYRDVTADIPRLVALKGQFVFAYGSFYPIADGEPFFEVQWMVFPGDGPGHFRHEEPAWWINQMRSIGTHYLKWQFNHPDRPIDYRNYRTFLHLAGTKQGDYLQETDTISRMVYGLASAYLLTGEEAFLEGAEKGSEYLREHMRFYDPDEDLIYWYHGIKLEGELEHKLLTSEFGDDYDSIPMYEQIYALCGPCQTYRVNGDPRILRDLELTVDLFDRHYLDREYQGYFSHLDPLTLDPCEPSLGPNRARKNWNSNGDHAPAYLINLYLATGEDRYRRMLEYTFDQIVEHFPAFDQSPFVQERFHQDWSPDRSWGWQQDRAVVGHNLKIVWNLMRIFSLCPKQQYLNLARRLAELMPSVGRDLQRCGWYDVMERLPHPKHGQRRYVWHDRKAWWQQEQAILAYLILHGVLEDGEYLRLGRESAAFYNAFMLDHDDGGIYFNTLANGLPYLLGTERLKGSHSMSAYHSMELCYLASVYSNLLITKEPLYMHFMPLPGGFADNVLRCAPDLLPPGRVYIDECLLDGEPHSDYDASALTVRLPHTQNRLRVRVRLAPADRPKG